MAAAFNKIVLDFNSNLFEALSKATIFEALSKGRIGNHLVREMTNGVPVVRTTSKYSIPAQFFAPIHEAVADNILETINRQSLQGPNPAGFNNALIEVYDASYAKMGYHSDQALDLVDDSLIAVFSCYENPDELTEKHIRKLRIKDKVTDEEFEYSLTHNSVILFSTETNKRFQHKIILDPVPVNSPDNKWLGITFRTSKTYILFKDDLPMFANGNVLTMADKDQETAFYKLRGEENRSLNFVYPELEYTISPADIMQPQRRI
ncbi:alpha-ketoglutarate-dependent dioxygenase AlkB [Chitinophaga sp. Cy-1792]|uniref:alpha-ketoglutarate-dependent dioxygenase AlkB n=1 Tax=Chitinophaga sp. Cy-1792 TaxID=2608339 RepID=UPI00142273D2|nr:alpha-ketoglutarate-dependent dioxygenase AlkB [Chitinophaga sp. Cy-1792]NIG52854.1 alpha-ketoglutarate-dependent dioxygenase AlkB [Chitinophaga sp. Cy-1792]